MIADHSTSRAREVVIDDFGIDPTQSALDDLDQVRATFLDALRSKNRSAWIIGDLWIEHSSSLSDLLDPSMLSLKTVENYASTCRAFPKAWRRVPVSISHYEAAAKLASVQPTSALELLEQAHDHQMSREWVRSEAAKLMGIPETTVEVLLTWDGQQQVFVPSQYLDLPAGTTRTIRLKL